MLGRKKKELANAVNAVVYEPETTYLQDYPTTERTFAFVDVSNYSAYTKRYGNHAAAQMLHKFRAAVRIVVGRHGVRVAKWLGDGVMLVSVQTAPMLEALSELNMLFEEKEFSIHSGVARGQVIIFEGDDYIGEAINIASRLADHANACEILTYGIPRRDMPNGLTRSKHIDTIIVKGVGTLKHVDVLSTAH